MGSDNLKLYFVNMQLLKLIKLKMWESQLSKIYEYPIVFLCEKYKMFRSTIIVGPKVTCTEPSPKRHIINESRSEK